MTPRRNRRTDGGRFARAWSPPVAPRRGGRLRPRWSIAATLVLLGVAGPIIPALQKLAGEIPSRQDILASGALVAIVGLPLFAAVLVTKRMPPPVAACVAAALLLAAILPLLTRIEMLVVIGHASEAERESATRVMLRSMVLASTGVGSVVGWVLAWAEEDLRA